MVEISQRRKNIILNVLIIVGGRYALTVFPDEPPRLGDHYLHDLKYIFEKKEVLRKQLINELHDFSDDTLFAMFSDNGTPISEEGSSWVRKSRVPFDSLLERRFGWYLAALGETELLADTDHWAKAAFLTMDEAFWLSVGLAPERQFTDAIANEVQRRARKNPVADYLRQRTVLFKRALDPYGHNRELSPDRILDWIERVELDVHPSFPEMLRVMIARAPTKAPVATGSSVENATTSEKAESRERISMAKLIVAMAIREYGYDPDAKRGPIPKEIHDLTVSLGIEVTDDTIRKYLKLGARYLPENWKPEI
jgi:hypothetical protein